MPPSLREWLPGDQLAWCVLDAVAEMDLAPFFGDYRADGHGRAAHDPSMMVALLLYAYAVGERSSRGIERHCLLDVAFRVIAANQTPDHATIARFRVRHERALGELFGQVLGLCAKAGLLSVGVVALDGTKLKANASGQANRTYEQIAREILQEAAAIDAAEDERFGERRGDELPAELADPSSRRARLREAKRQLDAEKEAELEAHREHLAARAEQEAQSGRKLAGRKPKAAPEQVDPQARANVTDPDSRSVRTARGFVQGYNAQAVANDKQIIIAAELTNNSSDGGQLEPMITAARRELQAVGIQTAPEVVLADAGYWHIEQISQTVAAGSQVLVPPDAERRDTPPDHPGAKRHEGLTRFMRDVLDHPTGRALYKRRKTIIEPIFGDLKHNRGADRFHRRGLSACRSELRLLAATHNLLKLHRAAPAGA